MYKKTILYGMGSWVDNHYLWLKRNFSIVGTYDRDSNKKTKSEKMGFHFLTLEELKAQPYDAVLITSTYEEEISDYLKNELQIDAEILSGNRLYEEWEKKYYNGKINHFGEKYPDKTFAVIQCGDETSNTGLFGLFISFVREISNALKLGHIPVVDMKNFCTIYHDNWEQVGKVNTWELFFKQPYPQYHIEDVENASKVTYAEKRCKPKDQEDRLAKKVVYDMQLRKEYHDIYRKYMQPSDQVAEEYQHVFKKIFAPFREAGERILGVSIRGTDYVALKPYLHEIQPAKEEVAEKIREAIKEWGIDRIYVNSDEEKSISYIKDAFPGMVFSMDYQRFDSYYEKPAGTIGTIRFNRGNDAYHRGADYLVSTLLLADCDCFIGSVNGCCIATLIMTEGFWQEYIFDKGMYGIDDDAYSNTPDGKPVYVDKA